MLPHRHSLWSVINSYHLYLFVQTLLCGLLKKEHIIENINLFFSMEDWNLFLLVSIIQHIFTESLMFTSIYSIHFMLLQGFSWLSMLKFKDDFNMGSLYPETAIQHILMLQVSNIYFQRPCIGLWYIRSWLGSFRFMDSKLYYQKETDLAPENRR